MGNNSKSPSSLKWFFYCDVENINSLFNQLSPSINTITKSAGAETDLSLSMSSGLPMVLQGFRSINASGEFERDLVGGTTEEIAITIEDKINFLLRYYEYSNDQTFDTWGSSLYIGTGNFYMVSYKLFCDHFERLHQEEIISWDTFGQFIEETSSDDHFANIWNDITKLMYPCKGDVAKDNHYGLQWLDADHINRFIAVYLQYPLLISFSSSKLLLSTSSAYFTSLMDDVSTGALGYITHNDGLYIMKPLALWHDIDYINNDRFGYQVQYQVKEKRKNGRMPF